jgi:hypothetical protein
MYIMNLEAIQWSHMDNLMNEDCELSHYMHILLSSITNINLSNVLITSFSLSFLSISANLSSELYSPHWYHLVVVVLHLHNI